MRRKQRNRLPAAPMEHRIRIIGVLIWTLVFTAIGGILGLGWFFLLSDNFRIKNVEIRGNAFLTDMQVAKLVSPDMLEGTIIWFANFDEISKQLEANYRIEKAVLEKALPDTIIVKITEPREFATVGLVDGCKCTVDRDGNFIRWLNADESPVGPAINGFSKGIFNSDGSVCSSFKDEIEAWSGFSSRPEIAGVLRRDTAPVDHVDSLRERLRFGDALRLAEATGINRKPEVSNYEYIGIDGIFHLFLLYPHLPPAVVGGYDSGSGIVDDLSKLVKYEEPGELICYDYIDLHLAGFGRGVMLSKLGTFALREWSDGKEAVRIAAWETLGEVESRL